jgi:acyl carrier protein
MGVKSKTIDDVRNLLIQAISAEANIEPEELATDQPFTAYGLDSMAALSVGVEIEDGCGLSDLPVGLMWDHPTVDELTTALWTMMSDRADQTAGRSR